MLAADFGEVFFLGKRGEDGERDARNIPFSGDIASGRLGRLLNLLFQSADTPHCLVGSCLDAVLSMRVVPVWTMAWSNVNVPCQNTQSLCP